MRLKPTIAIIMCITGLPSLVSADSFFGNLAEQLKTKVNKASELAEQVSDLSQRADNQIDKTATELDQARQSIEDARNFSVLPGAGSTNRMDVIGLRLGMTALEVKMALQRHDVTMRVQDHYSQLSRVPNSQYLNQIFAISNTGEQVVIEFAPPPREPLVVRLTRTTKFARGTRPTLINTQQALKQKYGAPTIESNKPRMHMSLWLHDGRGNRMASVSAAQVQRCTQVSRISIDRLIISQQQDKVMAECGASLDIQLGTGIKSDGLVGSLVATLSNPAEMARTTQQTRDYINKNIGPQAESIGAPKL